jgi:O-antigen/teichoic acid export membrane protein
VTDEVDIAATATAEPAAPFDPYAAGEAGPRVIRGGTLRVAGAMAGILAGAVSAPLVVRHLGGADYGRYLTVSSIIFVITALSEGGLANVAVRMFSVGSQGERRKLVASLTGLRLVLGAVGALAAVGFGLLAGYPSVMVVGLALGAAAYVASAVQGSYSIALTGTLRLTALASIDTFRSLLTTLLLIALVIAGSGLSGFYFVAVVAQAATLLVTAALVREAVPLGPAFDPVRWRALARETALYALAASLGVVYFQVALITMSLLDTAKQTGYYAISFRIVEIVNGVPWLLAGSVLPLLSVAANTDRARLRFVAGRVFEGAVIAGGLVAIVLVVGAPFGIKVIAGPEGHPAVAVLRLMGIGVTATFIVSGWGFVLLSLRRYRQLVAANLAALVLAIALSLVLIPALDARGGAITTAALEVTLASAYMVLLAREGIVPSAPFVGAWALALCIGLASGIALLAVGALLAVPVGGALYIAVLLVLGAVPSELIDALPWRR